jgi:RNA polymerase sigma-70 factor (sigma-E family)
MRGTSVTVHAYGGALAGAMSPPPPAWHDADADGAVEQLYAAHWRTLVRLGVLLLRDLGAAEEVVQDAFVALHGKWPSLRDPDRALAYLRRSVVNGSRSRLRHLTVVRSHAERQPPPGVVRGADEVALETDRRAAVLDALAGLPRRQREVLALRYYVDLSEAEIAETLGISRGAVKSHASRGAATLRELLAAHLEAPHE